MSLMATLGIDTKQFEEGLAEAKKSAQTFASDLSGTGGTGGTGVSFRNAFGGMMQSASRMVTIGAAGLTAAGGMLVKSAIDTGMQFDKGISQIAATLGVESTSQTVKNLREYAIETGETTVFTATEAAEALNYMALAGYDAEKSMRVLPDVLNLAAAGAMDLGYASDVVTDLGTALGLTEEQVTTMTDHMAKAASTTNTNVGQLSEAMLRLGANGRTVKGGTKEIAAVFGVLADNGLKGAEAGTHLRNILLKLANPGQEVEDTFEGMGREIPSLFNEEGGMKDLPGYFLELKDAIGDLSDEQILGAFGDLFNDRDIAAARALMETDPERWAEIFEKLGQSAGSAGKMAHEQLNNLAGDVKLFQSAYQTMQIRVSDALSPMLRDITQKATEGIKTLTQNIEEFLGSEKGVATMQRMSDAFGTLFDKLTSAENIEAIMNLITKAVEGLASAIEFIANNSDAIIATFEKIGAVIGGLFVADKVSKGVETISTIGKFFGLGGGGGAAGGAAASGAAGGGGFLSGIGKMAGAVLGGPVGAGLGFFGSTFAGFAGMDAYATNRDYGDLNRGLANMDARIAALEKQGDEKSKAYADLISSIGGILDSLNDPGKNSFDEGELAVLSEKVAAAQEKTGEDYSQIQSLIEEMMTNPNIGANEELVSSLGSLLVDLETKSQEQVDKMTEDVNVAAIKSLADFGNAMGPVITGVGTSISGEIDSGSATGAAAMGSNITSEGESAAASVGAALQAALNDLHLPSFEVSGFTGASSGGGRRHASAMSRGEILHGLTPFGIDNNGTIHYGGEAGAEVVVGANSLTDMIHGAMQDALVGVLSRMDGLLAGQGMGDVKVVLDTGATVGGLVREMDKQMGGFTRWRGGGRA